MNRREFITLLGGAAAVWPSAAWPQERVRRVGVLVSNPSADDAEMQSRTAAFAQGLREIHSTLGGNLQIEYGWSNGNAERLRSHAAELIALRARHHAGHLRRLNYAASGGEPPGPDRFCADDQPGADWGSSKACLDREATSPASLNSSTAFRKPRLELLKQIAPAITHTAVPPRPP